MSGYQKEPDYGGPPNSRLETAVVIGTMVVMVAVAAWFKFG
jgi:hypothetical protein